MERNLEVEVRVLVNRHVDLEPLLAEIGFEYVDQVRLTDIYYCPIHSNRLEDVAMNAVDSYSLRLRRDWSRDGCELNVKIITTEGDHSGWEEHEVNVSDLDKAAKIIGAIGFKEFFRLTKTRLNYKLDDITLSVDHIDDFGAGVELETFSDERTKAAAKERLVQILLRLGFSVDEIVDKSITYLVMMQRAHF